MTTPRAEVLSVKVAKDVVSEVAKNFLMGVPAIRRSRSKMGRTSLPSDAALLDRYAFPLLNRAKSLMDVTGVDVFEIGPGDHLSSGLALLAAGARSYTCADRFPGNYSSSDARTWYRMVRSAWPESYPAWPETLNAETFPEGCPGVKILPLGVESLFDVGTFDLVGSTSVGEHVSDITAFAEASHRLLRPGGFAIHHIDFAPHDCWRTDYDDPFIFLRFPEWLWRMMGSNRGIPNRRRFHEFLDAFETAGLSILVRERSLAYQGLPIPRRLKGSPADSVATIAATFVLTIPVRAKS